MGRNMLFVLVFCALLSSACAQCDAAQRSGKIFAEVDWLRYIVCLVPMPFGLLVLFFGLTFQQYTRRAFAFSMCFTITVWMCSVLTPSRPWFVPVIGLPVGFLAMRITELQPSIGLMLMGAMFGVFFAFSVIVLGLYVLWEGELWPTDLLLVVFALLFAWLIFTAGRNWQGIVPLGRQQLIPLYTSLLGSVAFVQPINYLTYNNMHAYMVIGCKELPEQGVYVYLAIVYGLMLIGLIFQLRYGLAMQREYIDKFIEAQARRADMSPWEKLKILGSALKVVTMGTSTHDTHSRRVSTSLTSPFGRQMQSTSGDTAVDSDRSLKRNDSAHVVFVLSPQSPLPERQHSFS